MKNNIIITGNKYNDLNDQNLDKFLHLTYIKKFIPFEHQNKIFDNDVGWGCTIRSCQMMTYLLLRNILQPDNKKKIAELFIDNDNNQFSIQNILKNGNLIPGNYSGPHNTFIAISKIINLNYDNTSVLIIDDGILNADKFYNILNSCLNIVILLAFRLENSKYIDKYVNLPLELFDIKNNIGFVGGVSNKSYYFIGKKSNQYICIDPHVTKNYTNNLDTFLEEKTMFLKNLKYINYNRISPTLLYGFIFHTNTDIDNFFIKLSEINKKYNIFSIINDQKTLNNDDINDNDMIIC